MSTIICNGNCFECPYPDIPVECIDSPLSENELKTAITIDLQAVKHSTLEPEEKERRMAAITKAAKDGKVAGVKKEKANHYSKWARDNRAAYGEVQSAIRVARMSRGWTCKQLAKQVGKSQQAVSYWELGYLKARWDLIVPVMPELAEVAKQADKVYREVRLAREAEKQQRLMEQGTRGQKPGQHWKASDVMTERLRKKMTAGEVAAAIGVTPETVKNWERGKTRPNWRLLATLFARFNAYTGE